MSDRPTGRNDGRATSYYAGIGSRKTPDKILQVMTLIAKYMDERGYVLRSGNAIGADRAFESGTRRKEVYTVNSLKAMDRHTFNKAEEMVRKLHGAWNRVGPMGRKLHTRNALQIFGMSLDKPVSLVICWTPDGCIHHNTRTIKTGGTGTAISLASTNGIRVINLKNPRTLATILHQLVAADYITKEEAEEYER